MNRSSAFESKIGAAVRNPRSRTLVRGGGTGADKPIWGQKHPAKTGFARLGGMRCAVAVDDLNCMAQRGKIHITYA